MTSKLVGLVEKWRRWAADNYDDAANARSSCADELEAALSAPAEEEEAVECKHEWQHDQDHPGWFCCQKCDVSRKPPLA